MLRWLKLPVEVIFSLCSIFFYFSNLIFEFILQEDTKLFQTSLLLFKIFFWNIVLTTLIRLKGLTLLSPAVELRNVNAWSCVFIRTQTIETSKRSLNDESRKVLFFVSALLTEFILLIGKEIKRASRKVAPEIKIII